MPYREAKLSAIGATIATAAGLTAPIAVSAPVRANITHGIRATRPRTARTAACTSQSVVPLARARANR